MSSPAWRVALLLAILVVAAALRFTGAAHGLRQAPVRDEQIFVGSVEGMLERGDLDHRQQIYPGFFFYLLLPVLALVPRPFGPEAYLAARCVVGSLGVASVALAWVLARRLAGDRAGLLAAAVLAVSPVEVFVAHEVRPDVALGFFALLTLILVDRLDSRWCRDAWCGAGVGMATAVKLTGVAVAIAYVARRLTIARNRWRAMVLAGVVSLLVFAALSPYSVLHLPDFLGGMAKQQQYHAAVRDRGAQPYWVVAATYVRFVLPSALGLPALLVAAVGLWMRRQDWRRLLPLVALPFTLLAIVSTAQITRSRFLIVGLGGLAVLAGLGLDSIWRRSRLGGLAVAVLTLGVALASTLPDVAAFRRPTTFDQALDWIEAHASPGALILNRVPRLGLDRQRFEILTSRKWTPGVQRIAGRADILVMTRGFAREKSIDCAERFVSQRRSRLEGPWIVVCVPVRAERSDVIDGSQLRLDASENVESLPLLVDGDLETGWETTAPQRPGAWIEAELPSPRILDQIELRLGAHPGRQGRRLAVSVTTDGRAWKEVAIVNGRPPVRLQLGERSQVLVLAKPTRASAVRITLRGRSARQWGVAELDITVLRHP